MKLAMLTINRTGANYVKQTVDSLLSSDFDGIIHLMVGNCDQSHIIDLLCDRVVADVQKICPPDKLPIFKLCWNFYRTFVAHGDDDLIICEDDILFDKKFGSSANQLIRSHKTKQFVAPLYLYAREIAIGNNIPYAYPVKYFWGNQCTYFSRSVTSALAKEMHKAYVDETEPSDLVIRRWCLANDIPMITCNKSLVKHIGVNSSVDSMFHSNDEFDGNVDYYHMWKTKYGKL